MSTTDFSNQQGLDKEIAAIGADRRSGASDLARRSVRLFMLAEPCSGVTLKRYVRAVRGLAVRAAHNRPAMAPIRGAVALLWHDFETDSARAVTPEAAFDLLKSLSRRVGRELKAAHQHVSKNYRERFGEVKRPMVISYSSQVIDALTPERGKGPRVTVCESRPRFEGRRTARILATSAREVTLITESEIGRAMGECDAAVLGCDAINADGSIVNKTGSYLIALAAKSRGLPVIVLGDRFKLAGREFATHEPHNANEVWRTPSGRIKVVNVYFETVPRQLVDFVVLDSGVYRARSVPSLWRAWQKWI